MKYEAIFKKYWNDNKQEIEKKRFDTVREILEYVYSVYENSVNCNRSFVCEGKTQWGTGFLSADYSLLNAGSLWLMRITYINSERKKIIVFDKNKFCSNKISNAFDAFAAIAAERKEGMYGEIE